jgi:hypothetical protein
MREWLASSETPFAGKPAVVGKTQQRMINGPDHGQPAGKGRSANEPTVEHWILPFPIVEVVGVTASTGAGEPKRSGTPSIRRKSSAETDVPSVVAINVTTSPGRQLRRSA